MAAREHEIVLYATDGTEIASVRIWIKRSKIDLVSQVIGAASVLVTPDPQQHRIQT